ncbi:MAG: hypothetical protein H8D87_16255 [Deltaproteobacteria bacterium]|uniref:hypothetical protein n=1 Tax=Desulfobacula sp. TaxID=2593537 RepID=UPI0019BD7D12|nr:hypothetical protein [Candidatus Desulfobacula maris]MBL6993133.1 hypothetical protein [Desulfobacula sp.]
MSASKDLERLVNQIASARNDRGVLMNNLKENFGRIKQDTAGLRHEAVNLLKSIGRDRQEMTQSLHGQLDKDRADLGVMEKTRQKETAMEHNARISLIKELKNELRSKLDNFMSDMNDCVTKDKKQRVAGIKTIKTEVGRLQEDTQTSLKQIRNSQKKMGDELSSVLKAFVSDVKANEKGRKSSVNDFLTSVKAEISAMSSAWGKVMSNVRVNDSEIIQEAVEPEPDKEDDTDEEPEGQELTEGEDETGYSYYDNGPIKEKVMTTLSDYSDGLKMTQLAELLDIEQWRTLIPVMRDLMDNNQIRKEGSLYFSL